MISSTHSRADDPSYQPVVIKDKQRFWKRILIIDDDEDVIWGCYKIRITKEG